MKISRTSPGLPHALAALRAPRKRLVRSAVSSIQKPPVLLGFQVRPVGEEHFTDGLRPQCCGSSPGRRRTS